MKEIILVAAGSGLGGVLRYWVQWLAQKQYPSLFPVGTFIVNLTGCLLIGILVGVAGKGNIFSADTRLFLATGFCGGFTTFSTFAMENMAMLRSGHFMYFLLYAVGSVVLGILATYSGMYMIK